MPAVVCAVNLLLMKYAGLERNGAIVLHASYTRGLAFTGTFPCFSVLLRECLFRQLRIQYVMRLFFCPHF